MKTIKRIDLTSTEVDALLKRVRPKVGEADYELIKGMAETIAYLAQAVEEGKVSASRLLRMLFGSSSEKTKTVLKGALRGETDAGGDDEVAEPEDVPRKKKGHGRTPAKDYTGAEVERIAHEALEHGDPCPECERGKVYTMKEPKRLVRITGGAPIQATVYEQERLRCNLCGTVFTAAAPDDVGEEKYDARVAAIIALLKYGSGFPFYRLAGLQEGFGVPMPPSVQWEIVSDMSRKLFPVYDELIRHAAQGDILHNDDTVVRILALAGDTRPIEKGGKKRKAVQTTGIVSCGGDRKMYLFFTGKRNAGENLDRLLAMRDPKQEDPVLMCDGLSANLPESFSVILSNCLAHGRRNFVEVALLFPKECKHLLASLADVYKVDEECRNQGMTPAERLEEHQRRSKPAMDGLKKWLDKQEENKTIEPNSSMGQAIRYMTKRWEQMTQFLRIPGAPLDNNICERALKKAILHRKNSLFYKTQRGAMVGDMFMGMIHTARENGVNPFDYLVALFENADLAVADPGAWLPWNYQAGQD
jgi:transposase